jgi:hypothetical protein
MAAVIRASTWQQLTRDRQRHDLQAADGLEKQSEHASLWYGTMYKPSRIDLIDITEYLGSLDAALPSPNLVLLSAVSKTGQARCRTQI